MRSWLERSKYVLLYGVADRSMHLLSMARDVLLDCAVALAVAVPEIVALVYDDKPMAGACLATCRPYPAIATLPRSPYSALYDSHMGTRFGGQMMSVSSP